MLLSCIIGLFALSGCAMPDWLVPRIGKPYSSSDSARQAQQDAYDRRQQNGVGLNTKNGTRTGMLGSSNYVPGASSNPFAP